MIRVREPCKRDTSKFSRQSRSSSFYVARHALEDQLSQLPSANRDQHLLATSRLMRLKRTAGTDLIKVERIWHKSQSAIAPTAIESSPRYVLRAIDRQPVEACLTDGRRYHPITVPRRVAPVRSALRRSDFIENRRTESFRRQRFGSPPSARF